MKKALYAVAVIATVTIAGWNYQQNKEVELSDLAMENVEALAN
jgi:predicted negative regulator of RcsB-dependent stress response